MRQLREFEKNYHTAVEEINEYLKIEHSEFAELTKLFLDTDANPYGFCPAGWADGFCSAQGFISLLDTVYHAMYDDGDITFFVVNDEPKFGFFPNYDLNDNNCLNETQKIFKQRGNKYEYHAVECAERIKLFREYHAKEVKRWFIQDATRFSVDFSRKSYEGYADFDQSWATDQDILKEIDDMRQRLIDVGILT